MEPEIEDEVLQIRELDKKVLVDQRDSWQNVHNILVKLKDVCTSIVVFSFQQIKIHSAIIFAGIKALDRIFQRFSSTDAFRADSSSTILLVYSKGYKAKDIMQGEVDNNDDNEGPRETLQKQQVAFL